MFDATENVALLLTLAGNGWKLRSTVRGRVLGHQVHQAGG
jgi:hypothetical protein